jgi:hypothetical protein
MVSALNHWDWQPKAVSNPSKDNSLQQLKRRSKASGSTGPCRSSGTPFPGVPSGASALDADPTQQQILHRVPGSDPRLGEPRPVSPGPVSQSRD